MCGICGVYDPRGGVDANLVRRMNETLHHRGPDADAVKAFGRCVLAYKRLSIIDLPTGAQPMSDEAGRSWIVYNGEIYNYKELRQGLLARGHTLTTNSDTETIVHLYEEKGPDAVHELVGMFAFAIWDEAAEQLLLVRDRLGIKPLYYYEKKGRIAFASEIKGILADSSVPRRLNHEALADYLAFQNVFGNKTFFEGIKILPPGHLLLAKDGRIEVREYWDLTFRDEVTDADEAVRRFGALQAQAGAGSHARHQNAAFRSGLASLSGTTEGRGSQADADHRRRLAAGRGRGRPYRAVRPGDRQRRNEQPERPGETRPTGSRVRREGFRLRGQSEARCAGVGRRASGDICRRSGAPRGTH